MQTKCTWHPQHQNEINAIFEKKAAERIKDTTFAAWNASKMPEWLREDVWKKLLAKWNIDEWKKKTEQAKANCTSSKGGSLHTGGSINFTAHKLRLEKERGQDMSHDEVFEEKHKKKNKDGTREHWEDYHKRVGKWQQTQPPSTQPTPDDTNSLWTEASSGVNKGRVYGLGVRRPIGHPNPLLANSSSSQNQEQMEDMRKEICDLKQQLDLQFGIFVKMQKFMRKHGHNLCDDEDEQTESDFVVV
ncbi:uncharacterized protein LOC107828714 [Nicotiana tabacum]|uniref:Uncharacterized protein LOC107828714 n=1 Tax=Nicotiana tabacum TaxID=4097 RepID=A0AC58STK1_TOBAC